MVILYILIMDIHNNTICFSKLKEIGELENKVPCLLRSDNTPTIPTTLKKYNIELAGQKTPRTIIGDVYGHPVGYYVGKVNQNGFAIKNGIGFSLQRIYKEGLKFLEKTNIYEPYVNTSSMYIFPSGYYNNPYCQWILIFIDLQPFIVSLNGCVYQMVV